MKMKSLPASHLAGIVLLLHDACPELTAESLQAAIRFYDPDKPAIATVKPEIMLTPRQVASHLSCSRGKVFELIKTGKLKRILLGKRSARISEKSLVHFISTGAI